MFRERVPVPESPPKRNLKGKIYWPHRRKAFVCMAVEALPYSSEEAPLILCCGHTQVISVCPFFGVNTRGSPRQDFLRTVAAHPHVMGTLAACVGAVPQSIRSGIISLFGGEGSRSLPVTTDALMHLAHECCWDMRVCSSGLLAAAKLIIAPHPRT